MGNITSGTQGYSAKFEHERLLSLINSMVDGVIAVNASGALDLYNGAALNILDVNNNVRGKLLNQLCTLLDVNNQPVDIVTLIQSTRTTFSSRDYRLQYDDGSTVNLYISIAPVHAGYGIPDEQNYVLMLRDISREKSLEDERNEFISIVSHELRTPLAIAEGNISNAQLMVKNTGESIPVCKALEQAHEQTVFLSDMINDLSTLSRAERDALTVEPESIDVAALLTDLTQAYQSEAAAKGLSLYTELPSRLQPLLSSKLYVKEILQNLVSNALKYSQIGHVSTGAKQKSNGVMIWIEDTGIGISKNDQEKIYDKFFRAENYQTRQTGGTGLGLYITLKLARLLHATITTESTLGVGSKFSVYFPNLR